MAPLKYIILLPTILFLLLLFLGILLFYSLVAFVLYPMALLPILLKMTRSLEGSCVTWRHSLVVWVDRIPLSLTASTTLLLLNLPPAPLPPIILLPTAQIRSLNSQCFGGFLGDVVRHFSIVQRRVHPLISCCGTAHIIPAIPFRHRRVKSEAILILVLICSHSIWWLLECEFFWNPLHLMIPGLIPALERPLRCKRLNMYGIH